MFLKPSTSIPIFLVLFFISCITSTTADLSSAVIHLTDETFDPAMSSGESWLIEFYAPWCGVCRGFEPKFADAASILAQEGSTVKLAKVNVDESPGLSNRFMISRLPTFYFIQNKEVRPVKIRQESSFIVNFVRAESWRDAAIWSGLLSPFSVIGRAFGYIGVAMGFLIKNGKVVLGISFILAAVYLGQSVWGNWKAATMVQNSPVVDTATLKKNE